MKQKISFLLIGLLSLLSFQSFSQAGLYISSGSNFFITGRTTLSIDSLVLTPSVNYNIVGTNAVTRDATSVPPPPATYIQRVFHLQAPPPPYSGDITIYYRDTELNGLNENALNFDIYNGASWIVYPATSRDTANNFVTTTGLSNISMLQLTLVSSSVLPITLSSFTVQLNHCVANLKWTTTLQQNSKNFEVQQSTDGVNFSVIAILPATVNSSTEQHYSYNSMLSSSDNYFRLRMVDNDNNSKLSPVVRTSGNCNQGRINAFPNPTKNIITVNGLTGTNELRLIDHSGKLISNIKTSNTTETIKLAHLAAGNYIIQVLQNNKLINNINVIKE